MLPVTESEPPSKDVIEDELGTANALVTSSNDRIRIPEAAIKANDAQSATSTATPFPKLRLPVLSSESESESGSAHTVFDNHAPLAPRTGGGAKGKPKVGPTGRTLGAKQHLNERDSPAMGHGPKLTNGPV